MSRSTTRWEADGSSRIYEDSHPRSREVTPPGMAGHVSCLNMARSGTSLRISFLPSALPVRPVLLIDPTSDMERTTLKLDPVRFAVGEKCYDVLVHERHVPHIEHQLLPKFLDDEQLLELRDILRLNPAAESEYHLPAC